MHRRPLLSALDAYAQTWAAGRVSYPDYRAQEENETLRQLRSFVERQEHCFRRSCLEGHITGSALVCNPAMDKVLLTLHAKLGKWLQLGGHIDEETQVELAALREAQEESGLHDFHLLHLPTDFTQGPYPIPFDCDIHAIPSRPGEPEHLHYDVRYLLCTDDQQPLKISSESKALRWLSLEQARELTSERSMQRQFDKLEALKLYLSESPPILTPR